MLNLSKPHKTVRRTWLDRALGIRWLESDVDLNWKGRALERMLRLLRRSEDAVDRLLGVSWAPSDAVLNWKGRMVERVLRVTRRSEVAVDRLLGVSWAPSDAVLNWRGRMRERPRRAWRSALRRALTALLLVVNGVCFAFYWIGSKVRRRTSVQSVLQLSIVSNKPFMISRVVGRQGLKSAFFALNTDVGEGILNIGWDYSMPANIGPLKRKLLEVWYLWTVLARYDVIHSHFNALLSHSAWEFAYLKRLGKVVVFTFRGCDLRSRTRNMQLYPGLNCCQECDYPVGSCDTDYQRSRIALAARYGDRFFVTTPDLLPFFPGSTHVPFIQPVLEGLDDVRPAPKPVGMFRVVTSSNHHGVDGTRFIVDAVNRLRGEGRALELIIVSGQPYKEAIAIYKSADVYVGKLRLGYYNNANIETMVMGVPNMSFIRDEFRHLAPDCPIIQTTPDTVYENLKHYLDRPDELKAIGAKGPAFVRRHHDADVLAVRLIRHYNEVLETRRGLARSSRAVN